MHYPLSLYFQISIMSRKTLSDDEIRHVPLACPLFARSTLEAKLTVNCTECAAAWDNDYFCQMLKFGPLTVFLVVETN